MVLTLSMLGGGLLFHPPGINLELKSVLEKSSSIFLTFNEIKYSGFGIFCQKSQGHWPYLSILRLLSLDPKNPKIEKCHFGGKESNFRVS